MNKNHLDGCTTEQIAYFLPCKGKVSNYGMGTVSMLVSDHMRTETTAKFGYTKDVFDTLKIDEKFALHQCNDSNCDNIYIRVNWNDVQCTAGKLEFSDRLKIALDAVKSTGKRWSFRVMQSSEGDYPGDLLPEFLKDKLPKVTIKDKPFDIVMPLYTDDYLKYWQEMLMLLGEQFDSDPTFEYADVSGFGLWGEGHHYFDYKGEHKNHLLAESWDRYEYVVDELIKYHKQAFPTTPMVLSLHLCDYEAGRKALTEGAWVRRDSFYRYYKASESLYSKMRHKNAAMLFETDVPTLDNATDRVVTPVQMATLKLDQGTNYSAVGFNGVDYDWFKDNMPALFEVYNEKLGFRLRPSIVWRCEYPDGKKSIVMDIANDGCATPPGVITFKLNAGDNAFVKVDGGDLGKATCQVEIPLPDKVDWTTYKLSADITLGGKTHPMRFATDCDDGFAPFELTLKTY